MSITKNPWRENLRESSDKFPLSSDVPFPSTDVKSPLKLLHACPSAAATPLIELSNLAKELGITKLYAKDERTRMGLGSFKALGAAHVIARHAVDQDADNPQTALTGRTYVTASAGNHGLSVAAGARVFGANAVIYLSHTVPEGFAKRLEDKGAKVVRAGDNYEESMAAAQIAAKTEGMILLSDSSWDSYYDLPRQLMQGYLALPQEIGEQMVNPPSHIFLQAGVGGLAGACAALFREIWGDKPTIVVVEPDAAPALKECIKAGKFVSTKGPVSNMGRLDCKEASLIALKGLARDADFFVTISDKEAQAAVDRLVKEGIDASPSAVAGLAPLLDSKMAQELEVNENTTALIIVSEGAA